MLLRRLGMLLRLLLLLLPVAALKVLAISQGWEVLRVTPLFAGLVTSNVFLIGFLFNGVLADYKESPKCPALLSLSRLNLNAELQSLNWAQPEADVTVPQRGLRGVGVPSWSGSMAPSPQPITTGSGLDGSSKLRTGSA